MRAIVFFLLSLSLAEHLSAQVPGSLGSFAELSEAKKVELVQYLRKKYKISDSTPFRLKKEQALDTTCYRQLTFEGNNSAKTWQLTMFLSPDGRFLTSEVFDTRVDPIEEERRKAQTLMTGLAQNKGASHGSEEALVTVVEFSDFQCPYCKHLAEVMDEVIPTEDKLRVVFHHMPLSMHRWAQSAAEGAACAQLQGSTQFWFVHDKLFRYQQDITEKNVKDKLVNFAEQAPGMNLSTFKTCLDNQMSLGLVYQDISLASANSVEATPTLFINGHRVAGIKDATQLRQLITQAKNDAQGEGSSTKLDRTRMSGAQ